MCRYDIKNVIAAKMGTHPDSQSLTDGEIPANVASSANVQVK
ncbi:hypothetical protein DDI_1639 [Dickeya dianthicola RNS04.9]|nr:hypothetical protein DDI_1639 [Dickeya dianthicola RNS04.9]